MELNLLYYIQIIIDCILYLIMIIELTKEDKQNILNEDGFEQIDSNNPNTIRYLF